MSPFWQVSYPWQNFFYNQSQNNKKEYHYNTSGTIHSFGYGAMYHPHPITRHTIDKFATSKFSTSESLFMKLSIIFNHTLSRCFFNCFIEVKLKKNISNDLEQIEKLEQKDYNF